jgi:hypothetical protein
MPNKPMATSQRMLAAIMVGVVAAVLGMAVSFLGASMTIVAAAAIGFIFVSVSCPILGVIVVTTMMPLHGLLISMLPSSPGLRYWKEIAVIALAVGSIMRGLWKRRLFPRHSRVGAMDWFVIAFAVYMCVRIAVDGITPMIPYSVSTYICFVALYFVTRNEARSMSHARMIAISLCVGATIVAIGAVVEAVTGISLVQSSVQEPLRFGVRRASFSIGSALVMGPYMMFSLGMTLWLYRTLPGANHRVSRAVLLACVGLQAITVFLSGTRAAWVQAFVALLTDVTLSIQTYKRWPSGSGFVLTVLTLALSALTIPNSGWYASLMYEDQALRMSRWRTSLSIVGSYPLAGIGPGKTLWATSSMRQSKFVTESYALQIVAETGLVGGLLFFGAYASAILGLLASLAVGRTRIRDARLFCITTCSMLIGYLPALVVGQSLNAPQMLTVFWAIMGLVSATLATLHNTGGWLAESGDKSQ